MKQVTGGVCAAQGFSAAGIHCGIRRNQSKRDLALIYSAVPASAAADRPSVHKCKKVICASSHHPSICYRQYITPAARPQAPRQSVRRPPAAAR